MDMNIGTHWIGSSLGLTAGLDILEKGKVSYFCWDSNHRSPSLQHSHYTNYATKETWWKGVETSNLTQDKDKWQAFVNMVMKFWAL